MTMQKPKSQDPEPTVTVAISKSTHRALAHLALDRDLSIRDLADRVLRRYIDELEARHPALARPARKPHPVDDDGAQGDASR